MKRTFLLSLLGMLCFVVFAQNTVIPNNSFETWWQDTCYVINGVGDMWMDDALCARSTDAAYGDFSLYLKTSGFWEQGEPNNVAYAVVGNTDNYPDLRGVPYLGSGSPDSLLLSYKAFMQNDDSAQLWVSFFKDGVQQSFDIIQLSHQLGYVDTAFALSEGIDMPDSVFMAYASGDVMGEGDTDGNEVWFDNVYFKETLETLVMAPYGDFEQWDTLVSLEMDELTNGSESVDISLEAYAGNYALTVVSNWHGDDGMDSYYDSFRLWGDVEFNEEGGMMTGGLPVIGERNMLTFFYKYELGNAQNQDTAEAILFLYNTEESHLFTTNVYLLPSDTFRMAHLWYSSDLVGWESKPDSMVIVFRASKFRTQLPEYSLEGNTLYIDSLYLQSEALGEINVMSPDTLIDNNTSIFVHYENTSGSGITEFLLMQEEENILGVDYGQEDGNKILIEASPSDTLTVYVRDYYRADILDSFMVAIREEEASEEPTILEDMPDPGFENWKIYEFSYPTGSKTRNIDDGDTAVSVEKVASPDGDGFALKLINVGQNSMGNNVAYAIIGSGGKDGMSPNAYTGATPNKIKLSYNTSISEGDSAMLWVRFHKGTDIICSDMIFLPPQEVYGEASFDLNLSDVDPDSIFIALASADVWGDGAVDGDFVVIDNVSFLNGTTVVGTPENGDFESWESLILHHSEAMFEQGGYVRRTEDAASGDFALYMKTVDNGYGGGEYPYHNPVLLWGGYNTNQGLAADRLLDELVFSYKYKLVDANYPDTAMASLVLYNQESGDGMWFGVELLPTSDDYREARISIDTSQYDWGVAPTMMSLDLTPSKYRDNYEPTYPFEGNELYIDDLYWHNDVPSEVEFLTPDTVVISYEPFKLRFAITGSRSSHYVFIGASTEGDNVWHINDMMNSEEDQMWFDGKYPEGDEFFIYMVDYYNFEVKDSVLITVDVASEALADDKAAVKVYPLPVTSQLTIEHPYKLIAVQLYDISGELKRVLSPVSEKVVIDFSNYPKGLYFISLTTNRGVENRVVIKR